MAIIPTPAEPSPATAAADTEPLIIESAVLSNEDGSSMTIFTRQLGAISISPKDNPDLWAAADKWAAEGGKIEAFQPAKSFPTPQ